MLVWDKVCADIVTNMLNGELNIYKFRSLSQNGLPRGLTASRICLQCKRHRRHGFNSWVGKIPWRRAWQPTLVFLPGEPHGQRGLGGRSATAHGVAESQTPLKRLSSPVNILLNFMWLMWALIFLTHSQKAIQVWLWWPTTAYRAEYIYCENSNNPYTMKTNVTRMTKLHLPETSSSDHITVFFFFF